MRKKLIIFFLFSFLFLPLHAWSGSSTPTVPIVATEQGSFQLFYFFDLRDRESYIQVMNLSSSAVTVHVQIFQANFNCNENDFYDVYTQLDTHIYNMRGAIDTNNGLPSGVVLPDDAYGFVAVTVVSGVGGNSTNNPVLIGSFRIVDDQGFEYRTNAAGFPGSLGGTTTTFSFNFNNFSGTAFADVVGITVDNVGIGFDGVTAFPNFGTFMKFELDIFDKIENSFSCADILFACVEQDDSIYAELLVTAGVGMAGFEFGINNSVPHSKDKGKICDGNTITEGFVRMKTLSITGESQADMFVGFAGINDGANRGSMEVFTATQ